MAREKKKRSKDTIDATKSCMSAITQPRAAGSTEKEHDPDRLPTMELSEDNEGGATTADMTVEAPVQKKNKVFKKDPKFVHDFIVTTLKKGVSGLVADFRAEKRANDFTKMKVFKENQAEGRNRYKDVGCLDNSRVELTEGPVNYIHANYVAGYNNPKKFICTQAPLPKTIADFWYMVVQEKCEYILMLCNHKEQGANKCADYFPRSVAKALTAEDVSVTATKVARLKFRFPTKVVIAKTELDVIIPGKKPWKCTHFHWRDWPDRGVPPADLAPVELCGRLNLYLKKSKGPVIVHCSAGIGRTGSMVLIDLLLEMQRNSQTWDSDLLKYMRDLRAQRNNSVQTEHQYLYVHMVMLNYTINHQHITDAPEVMKKLEKFTDDYNKYCKGF